MQKNKFWSIMVSSPYIIWIIITAIAFIFLFSGINHEGFWLDEAYSSAMVQHNFSEMVYFLVNFDKHPPLYYFVLKLFTMIFGSSEIALRSFSLLGTIAMIWLGAYPIRRLFGQKVALIFTGFIIILPATLVYSHEARMYTWANFFTLSGIVYGYSSVISNKKKDWVLFGIFTLAGIYTHYYSLVALFFGHSIIFIYILIKSRDRLIHYFIITGSILLLYLPWIFILLNHTTMVIKDFWIPPVRFWDLLNSLIAPFGTKWSYWMYFLKYAIAAFFLSIIIIIYSIIVFINKKNNEKTKAIILFISILFLTFAFATFYSLFKTPILLNRYMTVCSGLFILSVVLGITALKRVIIQVIAGIILILLIWQIDIIILTQKFNGPVREIAADIKQIIQPDDIMLYIDDYLPNAKHVFILPSKNSPPAANPKFFKSEMQDITDLSKIIGKKKKLWLLNNTYYTFDYINPDLFRKAGYVEKYRIKEYNYPFSWLKVEVIYFVLQDKTD
jgi:uncharacterized membrane protein